MKRKLKPLHIILSENKYEKHMPSMGIYFPGLEIYYASINSLLWYDKDALYPEAFLEPLPKQEEWFEVIYYDKASNNPAISDSLWRSKEELLHAFAAQESDYHWIKLRKVEI